MKKFFKFGCLGFIGIIVLFIILAVAFGGDEDKVSTGSDGSNNTKETTNVDDGSKKVDASSQSSEVIGLKVGLGEVKINKDKLEVGINVENTNDQAVSFYPDQGSAVIGDLQLDANLFLTDGDIGGDIQAGVKQDGVLEFLAPEGKDIDVKNVKEIKFIFGDAISEDFTNSEPVSFTVPVK